MYEASSSPGYFCVVSIKHWG